MTPPTPDLTGLQRAVPFSATAEMPEPMIFFSPVKSG
jgi:hypothetical protein